MTSEERKAYFNLAMHSPEQEKGGIAFTPITCLATPSWKPIFFPMDSVAVRAGHDEGKEPGLLTGAKGWDLWLQIDSGGRAKMMWGDHLHRSTHH